MAVYLDLTPEFFQDLIKSTDPGVSITSIEVTTGAGRGDNYTSTLYRVKTRGSTESGRDWTKSFICKCLPVNRARREAFKSEILFRNEVAFYTRSLPALQTFQASKGHDIFKEVPKVYLAKSHIIVLEDMKEQGFTMADRKKALDLPHCEALLTTLGHFHGVSLALKSTYPSVYAREITTQISECLFREDYESWYRGYYRTAGENALGMVKKTLNGNPKAETYVKRLEKFIDSGFFNRMISLVNPLEPIATLCHGDCWTNNFLFQYTDSGHIAKLCMVDFQFVRYASPAIDLVQLLFICTNRNLRVDHLNHLLRTYSDSFHETMRLLGCESNPFGGKQEIYKLISSEVHRCSQVGLGLALDMIPICNCDSEQAPDLYLHEQTNSETDKIVEQPSLNSGEVCRTRMTDLVVELVDKNII